MNTYKVWYSIGGYEVLNTDNHNKMVEMEGFEPSLPIKVLHP